MRAGRLRHRVDIQARELEQDIETGEMVPGPWVTRWEKCPAAIESISTREFVEAQANQSEFTARITIRYRPGVLNTMRVVHGETVYAIKGPPLPDKVSGLEYLTLMVAAGMNDE